MTEQMTGTTYKDILKQLKSLVVRSQFLLTQDKLLYKDKLIVKMHNLLLSPESHYFCTEAKLFIADQFITIADVIRQMELRGVHISRSGCEGRMAVSANKFIADFGTNAVVNLLSDKEQPNVRLAAIELTLLKLTTGIDYMDNALDKLLMNNGLKIQDMSGFSNVQDVTQEQLEQIASLLEPYTEAGKAKRIKELSELSHVLWQFRKASIDGSNDTVVNYILRNIM